MLQYLKENHAAILGDVRQRLGADNEDDESFDHLIDKMTPQQIVEKWSGWQLGDESWATEMIEFYEELKKQTKEK